MRIMMAAHGGPAARASRAPARPRVSDARTVSRPSGPRLCCCPRGWNAGLTGPDSSLSPPAQQQEDAARLLDGETALPRRFPMKVLTVRQPFPPEPNVLL